MIVSFFIINRKITSMKIIKIVAIINDIQNIFNRRKVITTKLQFHFVCCNLVLYVHIILYLVLFVHVMVTHLAISLSKRPQSI